MKKICLALLILFALPTNAFAYDVMFNTKSLIYHTPSCEWARKCTKNCVRIDHTDAQRRGGVPCKVCGGVRISGNSENLNGAYVKKDEMEKLTTCDLGSMETMAPAFDDDCQALHGKNEHSPGQRMVAGL